MVSQKYAKFAPAVEQYKYPSRFGSHKSMVVETLSDNEVLLEDEYGQYKTSVDRLDSGLADPNRFAFVARGVVLK